MTAEKRMELAIRSTEGLPAKERAEALIEAFAQNTTSFDDLDIESQKAVLKASWGDEIKDEAKRRVRLKKVNYLAMRKTFLADKARRSVHTEAAYRLALDRLDDWCRRQGKETLELTHHMANQWIRSMLAEGASSPRVRLTVSAASSFFSWLSDERADIFENSPFRGTRLKPKKVNVKEIVVPTQTEIEVIMKAARKPWLRAAITVMASAGLRVGGLHGLSVRGGAWSTRTKGKDQTGTMPPEAIRAIKRAKLDLRHPFEGYATLQIANRFKYLTRKLSMAGVIKGEYSVHDLRHAFAVKAYKDTKDIVAVRNALGHSSVTTTEVYLRSLKAIVS